MLETVSFSNRWPKPFRTDICGSVVTVMAILLPVIIGMAGLAVDGGFWVMSQRKLQTAVDAAVISAAWEVANGQSDSAQAAALREAEKNGYDSTQSGTLDIVVSPGSGGTATVAGTIRQKAPVFFSEALFHNTVFIASSAASAVIAPTGDFCLLALNPTVSGAISTVGNVDIESPNCGLASNSSSGSAITANGNVTLNVNDVSVVGGISSGTQGHFPNTTTVEQNQSAFTDPYADLPVPSYTHCTAAQIAAGTIIGQQPSGNTYYPGTYCGGISTHGTMNLSPGVYTLDSGGISLGAQANLSGTGVTLVLTSSQGSAHIGGWTQHGGSTINISAPTDGDMAGVAIYQDRNAPSGAGVNISGGGSVDVNGVIYTPSTSLDWGGNFSTANADSCTRIIADTIRFHGTPALGNNCAATGVKNIGSFSVKLTQ